MKRLWQTDSGDELPNVSCGKEIQQVCQDLLRLLLNIFSDSRCRVILCWRIDYCLLSQPTIVPNREVQLITHRPTLRAGHRRCKYGGVVFDIGGFEDVAALGAAEFGDTSHHKRFVFFCKNNVSKCYNAAVGKKTVL